MKHFAGSATSGMHEGYTAALRAAAVQRLLSVAAGRWTHTDAQCWPLPDVSPGRPFVAGDREGAIKARAHESVHPQVAAHAQGGDSHPHGQVVYVLVKPFRSHPSSLM
jgi:hypothetical protein